MKKSLTLDEIVNRMDEIASIRRSIVDLGMGMQRLRLDHGATMQRAHGLNHAQEKHKKEIDSIVSELQEAFGMVFPKLDEMNKTFDTLGETTKSAHKKNKQRIAEAVAAVSELKEIVEKKHLSLSKKIDRVRGEKTLERVIELDTSELEKVRGELSEMDKLLKKVAKYEYGSQLNVFSAGIPVGFTGVLNFKSGFTVAINGGQIDVTATGGAGSYNPQKDTGTVVGTSITLAHTPLANTLVLNINGQVMLEAVDFTLAGVNITGLPSWVTGNKYQANYAS